jgi:hypothetical protein
MRHGVQVGALIGVLGILGGCAPQGGDELVFEVMTADEKGDYTKSMRVTGQIRSQQALGLDTLLREEIAGYYDSTSSDLVIDASIFMPVGGRFRLDLTSPADGLPGVPVGMALFTREPGQRHWQPFDSGERGTTKGDVAQLSNFYTRVHVSESQIIVAAPGSAQASVLPKAASELEYAVFPIMSPQLDGKSVRAPYLLSMRALASASTLAASSR